MAAIAPESSFQATDLQRRAREVLDAARRPEGALIRDKDGTNFQVMLAGRAGNDSYALAGLTDVLRVLRLTRLPEAERDATLYGELGWLAALPLDAQTDFAWAYARAIQAIPATGVGPVEDLLYDWVQTARTWSDAALRESLTWPLDAPLDAVEL